MKTIELKLAPLDANNILQQKIHSVLLSTDYQECWNELDLCQKIENAFGMANLPYYREIAVLIPIDCTLRYRSALCYHQGKFWIRKRIDFLVEDIILEVKCKPELQANDKKQLLEYLNCPTVSAVLLAMFDYFPSYGARLLTLNQVKYGQGRYNLDLPTRNHTITKA